MKGTLVRILPLTLSRSEGAYYRLEFKLENGEWAATDIVTKYRNYSRWAPIIKLGVGTTLENLELKASNKVDGDSYPIVTEKPIPVKKRPGNNINQEGLF